MIKKCPRCSNENLKEDYKYCSICGLRLEERASMNNKQAVEQLKDLKKDRESFITKDADEIYKKDIEALDIAIKALEGTAQEVPVQEQWVGKCQYCGKENKIDLPANKGIVPKFCMNCRKNIIYQKNHFF